MNVSLKKSMMLNSFTWRSLQNNPHLTVSVALALQHLAVAVLLLHTHY